MFQYVSENENNDNYHSEITSNNDNIVENGVSKNDTVSMKFYNAIYINQNVQCLNSKFYMKCCKENFGKVNGIVNNK